MEESKQIIANSPISQAVELLKKGGDINTLEKMLELQERWDKNEAKKSYNVAMAEFKANPPKLIKTKHVKYGNTEYNHADLANITETINSALSKCGLSASWKTSQDQGIQVTCTISHILGHSESTALSSPPDTSGGKNTIQAIGSAVTYLQRYTLLALTGLSAHDQDDDGEITTSEEGAVIMKKLTDEISLLKTIEETVQYYRDNHKKYPLVSAELIKTLANKKAVIVKSLSETDEAKEENADS